MKISKLFHWLYAIVMLLPIFAIGITCGYAMFNKNAFQSYYGETINDKEKEEITDITSYVGFVVYDVDTYVPYSLTSGQNIFDTLSLLSPLIFELKSSTSKIF